MSNASDNASIRIMLADDIVSGGTGKTNIIGAGKQYIDTRQDGFTTPFHLFVQVGFEPSVTGQAKVEITLEDPLGLPVLIPEALDENKNPQKIQVSNTIDLRQSNPAKRELPIERTQIVLKFEDGLPLVGESLYRWTVRIDDIAKPEWQESFYVQGQGMAKDQ